MTEGTRVDKSQMGEPLPKKAPKPLRATGPRSAELMAEARAFLEQAKTKQEAGKELADLGEIRDTHVDLGVLARELLGENKEAGEAALEKAEELDGITLPPDIDPRVVNLLQENTGRIVATTEATKDALTLSLDELAALIAEAEETPTEQNISPEQAQQQDTQTEQREATEEIELTDLDLEPIDEAEFLAAMEQAKTEPKAIQIVAFEKKWQPRAVEQKIIQQPESEQTLLLESFGIPQIKEFAEMSEEERQSLTTEAYKAKIQKTLQKMDVDLTFAQSEITELVSVYEEGNPILQQKEKNLAALTKEFGATNQANLILEKIEKQDPQELQANTQEMQRLAHTLSGTLQETLKRIGTSESFSAAEIRAWTESERLRAEKEMELISLPITGIKNLGGGFSVTKLVRFEGRKTPAVYKPALGEMNTRRAGFEAGKSYKREWLAGQIARVFGITEIPATVIRTDGINGIGSYQNWEAGKSAGEDYPNTTDWQKEATNKDSLKRLGFFDYIVDNTDRTLNNFLVQSDGRVVGIDNGLIRRDITQEEQQRVKILQEAGEDVFEDVDLFTNEKHDRLRSRPLDAVAGEPIPEYLRKRVEVFLGSTELQEALKEVFRAALDQYGETSYDNFVRRLTPFKERNHPLPASLIKY